MPAELLEQINPNDYAVKFAGRIKGTLDLIIKASDTWYFNAVGSCPGQLHANSSINPLVYQ